MVADNPRIPVPPRKPLAPAGQVERVVMLRSLKARMIDQLNFIQPHDNYFDIDEINRMTDFASTFFNDEIVEAEKQHNAAE